MLQNSESNTLPSELLIRIQKIINEKMWPSINTTLNNSKEKYNESDWQPEELIIHQMLEITEMVETDLLNVTYWTPSIQ